MEKLFERASRNKWRFNTSRGFVAAEDLWDMPLETKSGTFDLNNTAKQCNAELKVMAEESFVNPVTDVGRTIAAAKLELVKYIISVKIAENEARRLRAANTAQREKLIAMLDKKQDEALLGLTPDEIRAQIAALEA